MRRCVLIVSSVLFCLAVPGVLTSCSNPVSDEPDPGGTNPQREEDVNEGEDVRAPNGTNLGAEPINVGTAP